MFSIDAKHVFVDIDSMFNNWKIWCHNEYKVSRQLQSASFKIDSEKLGPFCPAVLLNVTVIPNREPGYVGRTETEKTPIFNVKDLC